jgi:hypothetical protein
MLGRPSTIDRWRLSIARNALPHSWKMIRRIGVLIVPMDARSKKMVVEIGIGRISTPLLSDPISYSMIRICQGIISD